MNWEFGVQKGELQIVPQVEEIIKPQHTIAEKNLLPLNIFAIPWGYHKAILDRYDSEPKKALFYAVNNFPATMPYPTGDLASEMISDPLNNKLYL